MFTDYERAGIGAGLGSMLGGLFGGDAAAPYRDAGREYQKYAGQAAGYQLPFFNAGQAAIPQYQNWLQQQANPSGFINNLMNQYQESPWAKWQMQQGQNAANNAASASGMLGSTPFMRESQDYARNIASQDMNQWLQHVLGINTQYGAGTGNLMSGGQNAANNLSSIYSNLGGNMADMRYASGVADQNQRYNWMGGLGSIVGMFL